MSGWRTLYSQTFRRSPVSDTNLNVFVDDAEITGRTRVHGWEYAGSASDYVKKSYNGVERNSGTSSLVVVRTDADVPLGRQLRYRLSLNKIVDDACSGALCLFVPNTPIASYASDDYLRLLVERQTSTTAAAKLQWVQPGGTIVEQGRTPATTGDFTVGTQDSDHIFTVQIQWPHCWVYLQEPLSNERLLFECDLDDAINRDVDHRRIGYALNLVGSGRFNLRDLFIEQPGDYVVGSESSTLPPSLALPISGTLDITPLVSVDGVDIAQSPYTFENLGPGVSPRVVLDFPTLCLPGPNVQLFYGLLEGGTIRRDEDERFRTAHTTAITTVDPHRRIEEVIRTRDRRLTVVHSLRDVEHGTYALQRMNSIVYPAVIPPPKMPVFLKDVGNVRDLYWMAGQAWTSPTSQVTQTDWQLRVQVADAVDGVEVQSQSSFPGGYRPGFAEQRQSYSPMGGMVAGNFHDFTFTVVHGAVTMMPCAFRARTRRGTCYSAWRYFLVSYQETNTPDNAITSELVNCNRDAVVTLPIPRLIIYPYAVRGRHANPCEEEPGAAGPQQFLEGGYNPQADNPFLWEQSWIVVKRSRMPMAFEDENGDAFDFFQFGAIFGSTAASPGYPTDDPLVTVGHQIPESFP